VPLLSAADFAALKHIFAPLPAKGGAQRNSSGGDHRGATPNP
jgi:hypothetical protein